MSAPIVDPFNAGQAILPGGQLAHRLHWMPTPLDPTKITRADLENAVDLGYCATDYILTPTESRGY